MDRPSDMQPARAEPIRFTYEDYLGFPDDGRRHELVDGEHVVTPVPTRRHQELSGRLFLALGKYLEAHPVGHLYAAPIDVILSDTDVVQPDIVLVSNERREVLGTWIHGAPDLVVEIVSPSSRRTDEVTKPRLFDRFDVREYWVVDPEIEAVKVYRRTESGGFARAAELSREDGHVLESPLLPGLAIALRELFA
jgi:Uma2 family endonuclease